MPINRFIDGGASGGGAGDVVGPASGTDNAVPRFDGTSGTLLQDSGVTISDANVLAGATQLNVDNLRLDGNTLSSTNTNGNINFTADGSGYVDLGSGKVLSWSTGLALKDQGSNTARLLNAPSGTNADGHMEVRTLQAYNGSNPKVRVSGNLEAVSLASGGHFAITNDANSPDSTKDVGWSRVAAGVAAWDDGGTTTNRRWYQWGGQSFLAADATNATTTMAASGLSVTVTSGRKYAFRAVLRFTDDVAADGAKFDFDASTATATNFRAFATGGAVTTGAFAFISTTALATDFAYAATDGAAQITIEGSFEPSGNGTFAIQFAQNAHTTGTLTLHRGSSLMVWDMP